LAGQLINYANDDLSVTDSLKKSSEVIAEGFRFLSIPAIPACSTDFSRGDIYPQLR